MPIKASGQSTTANTHTHTHTHLRCLHTHARFDRFLEQWRSQSCKPALVFHGTAAKNTLSIINNGLVVPGTHGVKVRNGSAYGNGVYCSPNVNTASWYATTMGVLFACLALPGHTVCNGRLDDSHNSKVDSVCAGDIWVMRKAAQILPLFCFVLNNKLASFLNVPHNWNSTSAAVVRLEIGNTRGNVCTIKSARRKWPKTKKPFELAH